MSANGVRLFVGELQTKPAHSESSASKGRISAEEALRRLEEEVDQALEHLADSLNERRFMNQVHTLTRTLTGATRGQRERASQRIKLEANQFDDCREPREVIPLTVGPKAYRALLLEKGRPVCRFCGCKLTKKNASIDHVIPKAQGGTNSPKNLILACVSCNTVKSNRTPEQWANDILSGRN